MFINDRGPVPGPLFRNVRLKCPGTVQGIGFVRSLRDIIVCVNIRDLHVPVEGFRNCIRKTPAHLVDAVSHGKINPGAACKGVFINILTAELQGEDHGALRKIKGLFCICYEKIDGNTFRLCEIIRKSLF